MTELRRKGGEWWFNGGDSGLLNGRVLMVVIRGGELKSRVAADGALQLILVIRG